MSLLTSFLVCSQVLPTHADKTVDNSPAPTRIVHLDTSRPIPVDLPNTIITLLPRCKDGRCYSLFAVNPQQDFKERIEAFDLHGRSYSIDPAAVPDIRYGAVLDLAPMESGVAVLLHGDENKGLPGIVQYAPAAPPNKGTSEGMQGGSNLII